VLPAVKSLSVALAKSFSSCYCKKPTFYSDEKILSQVISPQYVAKRLRDNLVPDYITHVTKGGFYGWPWYYLGPHQDPRHAGKHPELKNQVIVPDVLLQSHMASLCLTFYDGDKFPAEYHHDCFASEHGSWNRSRRVGYKVIRVPMKDGKATGEFEDFLVGFVTKDGNVWGRPVGVAVAKDGALMVTDDGSGTVWRVAYTGKK
jgi:glucose/arabinose dehydrogenase